MAVDVIVPFRSDGGHRDRAWAFLKKRWEEQFPDWQVIEGACPDGPWVKALAIEDALSRSTADIIVISDSDVWTDGVADAVRVINPFKWAVPHTRLYRLSQKATQAVYEGRPIDPENDPTDQEEKPYTGVLGGGMVVIKRSLYVEVPMDPRFVIWGGEDMAAAYAWRCLGGAPWRGTDPMWHLWHVPLRGKDRAISNRQLFNRYTQAARNPSKMRKLIAEFKGR